MTDSTDIESLEGSLTLESEQLWLNVAFGDGAFLRSSLRALGYSQDRIEDAADLGDPRHWALGPPQPGHYYGGPEGEFASRQARQRERRASFFSRLGDWYAGRDYEVIDSERATTEVALFLLSTPPVSGCKSSFSRSQTEGGELAWNLTIAGNGPQGVKSFHVTVESEFHAEAGEAKAVFVAATIETQRVRIIENGVEVGRGFRYEPIHDSGVIPGLKVTTVDKTWSTAGGPGRLFALRKDVVSSASTYSFAVERKSGISLEIGFDALGMKHTLGGTFDLTTEAKFSCTLLGGHDYRLHTTELIPGVTWAVE